MASAFVPFSFVPCVLYRGGHLVWCNHGAISCHHIRTSMCIASVACPRRGAVGGLSVVVVCRVLLSLRLPDVRGRHTINFNCAKEITSTPLLCDCVPCRPSLRLSLAHIPRDREGLQTRGPASFSLFRAESFQRDTKQTDGTLSIPTSYGFTS